MFWNQAASFAGTSSSYIAVKNSSSLNITNSFTLEAWVYANTVTGFGKGIISKGGASGNSQIYGMRIESGGRISFFTNGSTRIRSKTTTTISVNQWTHVFSFPSPS